MERFLQTPGYLTRWGWLWTAVAIFSSPTSPATRSRNSGGQGTVFANTGINNPVGIAFDGAGNLYVANQWTGTIEKYDSSGNGTLFSSGLNQPYGLAYLNGFLYVGTAGDSTITKLNSAGQGSVFATASVNNPIGLAFDSSGNLYEANYWAGNIEKFDSSGNGTFFASTPSPTFILIVPEPSSNALALLGAGVFGAFRWRNVFRGKRGF